MASFRPTLEDDLDQVLKIEQDPENLRWICPYSRERHIQVINSPVEHHFVLEHQGSIAGFIILAHTEKEHQSIEFRRIAIQKKGLGLGRFTVRWIKDWAFNQQNAHRLWLDVFTDNIRAQTLYKSEGFIEEGVRRQTFLTGNTWRSQMMMSILKVEYENQKKTF